MKLGWIFVTAAAMTVACAPIKQKSIVKMNTLFDESAHAPYLAKGTQIVKGQAFLLQRGGGNVTCAGRPVLMMPDTPYYSEAAKIMVGGSAPQADRMPPAQYAALKKITTCDAQGNFEFEGVPPGRWLIMTEVTWIAGTRQGGGMLKRFEVGDGGTGRILLTDHDRIGN